MNDFVQPRCSSSATAVEQPENSPCQGQLNTKGPEGPPSARRDSNPEGSSKPKEKGCRLGGGCCDGTDEPEEGDDEKLPPRPTDTRHNEVLDPQLGIFASRVQVEAILQRTAAISAREQDRVASYSGHTSTLGHHSDHHSDHYRPSNHHHPSRSRRPSDLRQLVVHPSAQESQPERHVPQCDHRQPPVHREPDLASQQRAQQATQERFGAVLTGQELNSLYQERQQCQQRRNDGLAPLDGEGSGAFGGRLLLRQAVPVPDPYPEPCLQYPAGQGLLQSSSPRGAPYQCTPTENRDLAPTTGNADPVLYPQPSNSRELPRFSKYRMSPRRLTRRSASPQAVCSNGTLISKDDENKRFPHSESNSMRDIPRFNHINTSVESASSEQIPSYRDDLAGNPDYRPIYCSDGRVREYERFSDGVLFDTDGREQSVED